MAFIDNSGDVILDMVLTDLGRERLARGDGSFKIVKFAVSDDEIDYSGYNKSDSRGSAYFDLSLLQTPVLEAFTNNGSTLKHKLLSIPRTDLLYLPIIKVNTAPNHAALNDTANGITGVFVVAVDTNTEVELIDGNSNPQGVLAGANPSNSSRTIRLDQGLDTTEIHPSVGLPPDLLETQYLVEIDRRLGTLVDKNGVAAQPSFIDDDDIATFILSLGTDGQFVSMLPAVQGNDTFSNSGIAIAGPRGTSLEFGIKTSLELRSSNFYFDKFGTSGNDLLDQSGNVRQIDSIVRVVGRSEEHTSELQSR
jgi:hypothetical protein